MCPYIVASPRHCVAASNFPRHPAIPRLLKVDRHFFHVIIDGRRSSRRDFVLANSNRFEGPLEGSTRARVLIRRIWRTISSKSVNQGQGKPCTARDCEQNMIKRAVYIYMHIQYIWYTYTRHVRYICILHVHIFDIWAHCAQNVTEFAHVERPVRFSLRPQKKKIPAQRNRTAYSEGANSGAACVLFNCLKWGRKY